MEKRFVKYQEMIDSGKNINRRLDSLNKTAKELESRLLVGKTPSLAAVEVQKIMQESADRSQVEINSVKVLKPEELDNHRYLRVPVEFQILPTIKQLTGILYRLETSPKYLTVKKIFIRDYSNKSRQLTCSIIVAGLMKRAEN
ncbi:MAG: GspMb/PilO family protein [Pseudomonadota bacterium]